MASFENELERWRLQETAVLAKLLHPMASTNYTNRLSPAKSISSIDHLLHHTSRVDSAYSSFSGGSNLPDYPSSPLYNVNYCLPPEQLSYMDSEYVRAIYNPSVVNSDLNEVYPLKPVDISRLNSSEHVSNANVGVQHGSTPCHGSAYKPPLPPLPQPPSPPARLDSYKARWTFDKPKGSSDPADHLNQSLSKTPPGNGTNSFISTCDTKGSRFQDSWKSRQKNEGLPERGEEWDLPRDSEATDNPSTCTKRSSLMLKESLQSGSVAKTQKVFCAQKAVPDYSIPGQANSKSSQPPHSSHNVNDLLEGKQYFYPTNFHKQTFSSVDRQGAASDSTESKFPLNLHHTLPENNSEQDENENMPQGIAGLKYASRASPRELMSDRVHGLDSKGHHQSKRAGSDDWSCSSEEEMRKDTWELSLNPPSKPQDSSQLASLDGMEASPDHHGEPEFRGKRLSSKSTHIFYCGPKAEPSLITSGAFRPENPVNESGEDFHMNPKREVTTDTVNYKAHLESQKSNCHPLCDLTSEKITKEKTPMLYHLASGRPAHLAAIFNLKSQTPQQDNPGKVPKKAAQSNPVPTAEGADVQRESKPLQIVKSQQFTDPGTTSRHGDETPAIPRTSLDDSLMDDYREKLKVAQKKVLRETSFKRKDLQMSLPIRLKLNPSKRPSIEHFKSLSLTNASEEVGFTPLGETLETVGSSKSEEMKKPLVSRIGGRKRQTKEEKKLYYSEPEKLDQFGVLQDPRPLRKGDSTGRVSGETAEEGLVTTRKIAFENRERARSASNLSKTELKQIQHTALIQYIERKTGQRSTSTSQIPLQKPTQRPPPGRRHSEWSSSPSNNPDTPHAEVSSQLPPSGRSPESSSLSSSSYGVSEIRTERLGDSFPFAEATQSKSHLMARETDPSYAGQSPFPESLHHSTDPVSAESRERIKSSPHFQISHRCSAFTPPAQNCDPHIATSGSHTVSADGKDHEKQSVSSIRGRGKSMEEIGTSDMIRLSVLSQSTDQLHHVKGLEILPVLGPQQGEQAPGENRQSNLTHSPENVPGNLPKQANSADIARLRGADSRISAFQRYSSTVQCRGVSASADRSSSSAQLPPSMLQGLELQSGYPDPSPLAISPVDEDDVFLKDFSGNSGLARSASHGLHRDAAKLVSTREEASVLPPSRLSCPVTLEEEPARAENASSAHGPENEDIGHELVYEAAEKMQREHTSDPENGKETRSNTVLLFSKEETSDAHVDLGRTTSKVDDASVRNSQHQVGSLDGPSSQGSDCYTSPSSESKHDHNDPDCESAREEPENVAQDRAVSGSTTDLPPVNVKSPEDERCEALALEIIAKDQSLVDILDPHLLRKTAVDLMEGLFPVDISLLDRSRRRQETKTGDSPPKPKDNEVSTEPPTETSPKPSTPLLKYQAQGFGGDPRKGTDDITSKKMELISQIQTKLQRLCGERELLLSDMDENSGQGAELEAAVKEVCKPNEYDRYMMFIGDLEKVVSLLLCLSMRLARVENARSKVNERTDAEERHSLNERHNLLSRQREDAKDLKDNLDRREKVVSTILIKYLSEEQLQAYRLFVKLKTCLLIQQKDLDEKIKFHEEQLERLQDSIPA